MTLLHEWAARWGVPVTTLNELREKKLTVEELQERSRW